jgi:hypothetical protein
VIMILALDDAACSGDNDSNRRSINFSAFMIL